MTASAPQTDPAAAPKLTPAEARIAAQLADRRAAEARSVADRAKKIAKKARAAATDASFEAARYRATAEPQNAERLHLTPTEAKARLVAAAKAIDPVGTAQASLKDHPFATVGIAAGVGVVLGSTGGLLGNVLGGGTKLVAALLRLVGPTAFALAKVAATQAAARHADGAAHVAPASPAAATPPPAPQHAPAVVG